jgi:hypothetical protein
VPLTTATAVPAPSSLALMAAGRLTVLVLCAMRRRAA